MSIQEPGYIPLAGLPRVSVIMPVRNQVETIVRSLGAVLDQHYPRELLEVIVVDGMSDDGTHAVLQRATYDRRVRLIDNPRRTDAVALNLGLQAAQGEVIIRVDSRSVVAPDYVASCVAALGDGGAAHVAGPLRLVGSTPWGWATVAATHTLAGDGSASLQGQWVEMVAMGAYRRELLERLGGWDETLAHHQDHELHLRLQEQGGQVLVAPTIVSASYVPASAGDLWRHNYEDGLWNVPFLLRYPSAVRSGHLAPPLLVLALIGGALLAPFSPLVRRIWALLIWSYGLLLVMGARSANLKREFPLFGGNRSQASLGPLDGGALKAGQRRDLIHERRLVPLSLACMHLSYGWGFLVGIVRWILSKEDQR